MFGRIDAHHHFWDPELRTYPWMDGGAMDPVRRAFTAQDLAAELTAADVTGTVLVQTVSDLAETREFLCRVSVCSPIPKSEANANPMAP